MITSEERTELRALCTPLRRWAGYAVAESIDGDVKQEDVIYWRAAEGIERLLDALERVETRERLCIERTDIERERLQKALLRYGDALDELANPVDGKDTPKTMANVARHALNPEWPREGVKNGLPVKEFARRLRGAIPKPESKGAA